MLEIEDDREREIRTVVDRAITISMCQVGLCAFEDEDYDSSLRLFLNALAA